MIDFTTHNTANIITLVKKKNICSNIKTGGNGTWVRLTADVDGVGKFNRDTRRD